MLRARDQGLTLKAAGGLWGVKSERARQLCNRTSERLKKLQASRPISCRDKGPCGQCADLLAGRCEHNQHFLDDPLQKLSRTIPPSISTTIIATDTQPIYFPYMRFFDYEHAAYRLKALLECRVKDGSLCYIIIDGRNAFSIIAADLLCDLKLEYPEIKVYMIHQDNEAIDEFYSDIPVPHYPSYRGYMIARDKIIANIPFYISPYITDIKGMAEAFMPSARGMIYFTPRHRAGAKSSFKSICDRFGVWSYNAYELFCPPPRASLGFDVRKSDKSRACCLTGLSTQNLGLRTGIARGTEERRRELTEPLDSAILDAAASGYDTFIFGLDKGFGLLGAIETMKLRHMYGLDIKLVLCPLKPGQRYEYLNILRRECDQILPPFSGVDECREFMLSHTSLIICYSDGKEKWLEAFLANATSQGVSVRNLEELRCIRA